MLTRRHFLATATAALLSQSAQAQDHPAPPTSRPDVARIDHDRILAAAAEALTHAPAPIPDPAAPAFLQFTLDLPALAAAHHIAPDPHFPAHAASLLAAAFPALPRTLQAPADTTALCLLAETFVGMPFLQLEPAALTPARDFARALLTSLTDSRTGGLARDSKDHVASAHLLLTAALARFLADDAALSEARTRINRRILRDQISAKGLFPNELTTTNPFRNTLFNLDLLAGSAVLLATPFDSPWTHELPDGPGLRAAIAELAPFIAAPATWPYPADDTLFAQLPGRRPALLFAARAYSSPDYATLWRTLTPAQPAAPDLLRAFPIRQPVLWTTKPPLNPSL